MVHRRLVSCVGLIACAAVIACDNSPDTVNLGDSGLRSVTPVTAAVDSAAVTASASAQHLISI